MLNHLNIVVACTLSASNDYMTDVGLNINVDHALGLRLVLELEALAKNITAAAAGDHVTLTDGQLDTNWAAGAFDDYEVDACPFFHPFAPASSDRFDHPIVLIVAQPADANARLHFANDTITSAQFDWLALLIREQLALCLLTLNVEVNEASPYTN